MLSASLILIEIPADVGRVRTKLLSLVQVKVESSHDYRPHLPSLDIILSLPDLLEYFVCLLCRVLHTLADEAC